MSSIIKVDTIQDQDGNNIINENANTITIGASGDTITIPSGATLANNGTATGFASIAWQSSIVTGTTLSAVAGKGYWIDTTSNTCTITLPGSASVGDQLIFTDYARTWNTNKIIIDSNGLNYQGDPDTYTVEYNTNGQTVNIVYSGATKGWIPVSDDDVTDAPISPPYDIDFLVIAGGAGGGGSRGGGGGSGGYRTSTQTVGAGITITVTVGDGGSAGIRNNPSSTKGGSGSNSSISGTGLTTITSAGGGGGGTGNGAGAAGVSGGSGGGESQDGPAGVGLGNTPSTVPSQGNDGGTTSAPGGSGGGGGGAGATGGNSTINPGGSGGNGGNGTASSITGSSVTRAGGGGGGVYLDAPATSGSGGSGGGGAGGSAPSGNGVAGTVNTGGGGGGGCEPSASNGGAGGKGVVILSMPDASYSGTTTGSPTVATGVSGKTVLTFTGSGSYTT